MRLLLDTNVLISLVEERLSKRIQEALLSPEAALHASVASLWEIAIKFRLRKLVLRAPPAQLPELIESMGLILMAIEASHVLAAVDPDRRPAIRSTACCLHSVPWKTCIL